MKRVVSLLLLAGVLLTGVLCFSSCGEQDDGAEISVYLTDRIWGFDPAKDCTDDSVLSVLYLLYEPLFTLDEDGDIHPALAKKYEYDKDTRTLTVTLRETYWSSGDRVTADDVVYAWKRILNPNNSFSAAPLLYGIENAREVKNGGTKTIDDLGLTVRDEGMTLLITLEDPDPTGETGEKVDLDAFLRNLTNVATAPVNYLAIQEGAYWSNTTYTTCYTNGPFKIQELKYDGGYFTLSRNDGYHRAEDSKKDVDYFVLPSFLRTQWEAVLDEETTEGQQTATDKENVEKQYDMLLEKVTKATEKTVFYMADLSLADRAAAKKNAVVTDSMSTYTYVFDTTNELFASPEVRTILSQVLDREYMVSLVTFGRAANGFVSYGVWDSTSARTGKSFRKQGGDLISSTAALTTEAALAQLNALDAPRGSFTLTYQDREETRAIAEYVKSRWEALGYTVELEPVTYYTYEVTNGGTNEKEVPNKYYTSALQYRFDKGDYDVIGIDYQMMSTNAVSVLATLTSNLNGNGVDYEKMNLAADKSGSFSRPNCAGYVNAAYDELVAKALATPNLKDRAELLHEAEKLLVADMPVIPLIFNQNFYVVNKSYLKGLDVNYYGYTLFTDARLKKYEQFLEDKKD